MDWKRSVEAGPRPATTQWKVGAPRNRTPAGSSYRPKYPATNPGKSAVPFL
jgi:hypothetical protein